MPIIDVELVTGAAGVIAAGTAQSLADVVGRTLGSPPGQTWVRVRVLPRDHYAENGSPVAMTASPVFVTVLKRTHPARTELAREISALTEAIAQALGRPASCVHVEYAPAAAGRLAFGGRLVE
jgi:phenylpyruvate tautomerase PptA (4-oxalocrotonate tautomerase family)